MEVVNRINVPTYSVHRQSSSPIINRKHDKVLDECSNINKRANSDSDNNSNNNSNNNNTVETTAETKNVKTKTTKAVPVTNKLETQKDVNNTNVLPINREDNIIHNNNNNSDSNDTNNPVEQTLTRNTQTESEESKEIKCSNNNNSNNIINVNVKEGDKKGGAMKRATFIDGNNNNTANNHSSFQNEINSPGQQEENHAHEDNMISEHDEDDNDYPLIDVLPETETE